MKGRILPGLAWSITIILCTAQHTVSGQMEMWGGIDMDSTAVLDVTPVTVTVEIGTEAKLPCPITNPGGISVTWLTADMTVVPIDNTTITVSMEGEDAYSLIFTEVSYQNQGIYQCMLSSFPPSLKEVTLSISGPPVISRDSIKDKYSLKEGSELHVTCDTMGNPEPSIKWYVYKNEGDVKELFSSNKVLRIPMISKDDAAIFRCEAKNIYGEDMFETLVGVMFKPLAVVKPTLIQKKEGESMLAVCVVKSNPRAKVSWIKQVAAGRNLSNHQTPMTENDHQLTQELMLKVDNLTVNDSGVYRCLALNKLGYTDRMLTVVVAAETTTQSTTTTVSSATDEVTVKTTIPTKSSDKITNKSNKPDELISSTSSSLDGPKVGGSQQDNSASLSTHFSFWGLLLTFSLTFLL